MSVMRILIEKADWVVTVDANRRLLQSASILIENDRIAFVGPACDLPPDVDVDRRIDGDGLLVAPGFVDTHVHNTQQLGRGLADECDLPKQLLERLYGYESILTSHEAYLAAKLCQLELIKAGTTCFLDPSSHSPDETTRAVSETGIRGVISRTAFDVHRTPIGDMPGRTMFRETLEEAMGRAEQTVVTHRNTCDGRLDAWFALRILAGCSDELCRRTRLLADRHGTGIVMHASESRDEIVASRLTSGASDVERLEALGVLGPNMVMIHMGWASPKEIELARRYKFKISHTPASSYRIAMGDQVHGKFPEMAELGVTVSLSCNSAMSSNFMDMVRLMNIGAGAMRSIRLSAFIFPPEQMIEMATVNGAIALDKQHEIGSIEVGKRADIVAFDTMRPEWRPMLNPLSNLVHSARGGAHTVIVDGRILLDRGEVTFVDERALLAECQSHGLNIAARSGLGPATQSSWPCC
jgi:5-methylthioadenosine/S-adenosylhomocysteine deaminase